MTTSKKKRIIDEKLLSVVRRLPCLACATADPYLALEAARNSSGPISHPHHVKTVKSGGDDVPENVIALCVKHHIEVHNVGTSAMAEKYKTVKSWLVAAGWEYDEKNNKWSMGDDGKDE